MFFVIDKPYMQRIISIVRDDRTPATQGICANFLRFAAQGDKLKIAGYDIEATIPATVWEEGVLFIRPTVFRRMLRTFKGEKFFAIQVKDDEVLMGNVRLTYEPYNMQLFPDPSKAPPRWPLTAAEAAEWSLRSEHGWAINIILNEFNTGLERICNDCFSARRYRNFQSKQDPIYHELLNGMEDEALAKTFVSYWTIAQTMATQSRFWLETAVAKILIHKYRQVDDPQNYFVLNQGLLSEGYLQTPVSVANMGEKHLKHLSSHRVWREEIDAHALETIDILVGQQELERVDEPEPFQRHTWTDEQKTHAKSLDQQHHRTIAKSFKGQATRVVNLQCNLLVIEPYKVDGKPHVWAFRFINLKKISSHPQRKQERVNLLRLYALLMQEKIIRDTKSIQACVCELVTRQTNFEQYNCYPEYFSPETYWATDRLWKFIGVPFNIVSLAIRDAAKQFRQRLIDGLRGLLPKQPRAADKQQVLFPTWEMTDD